MGCEFWSEVYSDPRRSPPRCLFPRFSLVNWPAAELVALTSLLELLSTQTTTAFKTIVGFEPPTFRLNEVTFGECFIALCLHRRPLPLGKKSLNSSPEFGSGDNGQLLSNDTLFYELGPSLCSPGSASPSMEPLPCEQAGARAWGPVFSAYHACEHEPVGGGSPHLSAPLTFNWLLQHSWGNEKCWRLAPPLTGQAIALDQNWKRGSPVLLAPPTHMELQGRQEEGSGVAQIPQTVVLTSFSRLS